MVGKAGLAVHKAQVATIKRAHAMPHPSMRQPPQALLQRWLNPRLSWHSNAQELSEDQIESQELRGPFGKTYRNNSSLQLKYWKQRASSTGSTVWRRQRTWQYIWRDFMAKRSSEKRVPSVKDDASSSANPAMEAIWRRYGAILDWSIWWLHNACSS